MAEPIDSTDRSRRYSSGGAMLALGACLLALPAGAQTTGTQAGTGTAPEPEPEKGIPERSTLLGDAVGVRPWLGDHGVTVNLTESFEVLGNVSGGFKRGATADGLATLTVQVDTGKAFGIEGGTINVSGLQIQGRNLSQYYLGNLQVVSGIEAQPSTRLWEAWYQQTVFGGAVDIRAGLISIDQEFLTSQNAALFLNSAMGWPVLPSFDLYGGGPAYPLSSLGVRLRTKSGPFTVLSGVFDDNPPAGPFFNDFQTSGPSRAGYNFSLRTGALAIAELQFALNPPQQDTDVQPTGQTGAVNPQDKGGLSGVYKIGAWYDSAALPNQKAEAAFGIGPTTRRNNYSFYAMADQMIWRTDDQSVSVFGRAMAAPSDRNPIDFSANGGVVLKGPLPGRGDDSVGAGFGWARVSGTIGGPQAVVGAGANPYRSNEQFYELFYQLQVTPWLQLQPDFQYVVRPGGGVPDPNNPARRLRDEAVFGIRTNIVF